MELNKQYNNFAEDFVKNADTEDFGNDYSRNIFYQHIDFIKPGVTLIDLACGDGFDLAHYQELGAEIFGIDASEEMVRLASQRLPEANIQLGLFEKIPFEDNYFDVVVSKYALMTSADLKPVFSEILRVLKPGGVMMYLVTHPFRQYFEKKNTQADYFKQEIVDSNILNMSITVNEPTHVMGEYLNDFLFTNFDLLAYDEKWDPAAEPIDGKKFPGFLIIKARKKQE